MMVVSRRRLSQLALWIACLAVLSACGGGGGGSSGAPTPQNRAPEITSSNAVAVAENTNGVFYNATASDADGDTIAFSIVGGADGALFEISSGGGLRFSAAPDFESPNDADQDNVYQVDLAVEDGRGGRAVIAVSVTVTDEPEGIATRYLDELFSNIDAQRGVLFASAEGTDLFLDVFQPAGDAETNRPAILLASGGGFLSQVRDSVEPIALAFARRGYVALTFDYRTLPGGPANADELAIAGLRATHDLYAAVRYLRANASTLGVNASQIFVGGESAGGVLAAVAVTFDPTDPAPTAAVQSFLDSNGGVYGDIGDNDSESPTVQGALVLSGAILDLSSIDANSTPFYGAHEEFDMVVPCGTAAEGSSGTGLVASGACAIVPAYQAAGVPAELYLVEGSSGHVSFTGAQRAEIYQGAANLFFANVIGSTGG